MILYKIRGWNDLFENNRTRDLAKMQWVPIPNKQDGDGYTELLAEKDGPALFGAWIALVQVASKCIPRGILIRESGEPHTPISLSRITRFPNALLVRALPILLHVRWIESEPYEIPQVGAAIPQVGADAPPLAIRTEWNGMEGMEKNGMEDGILAQENGHPLLSELPSHLNTARMQNKWQVWQTSRRGHRKPKSWPVLFNEQIEWLSKYDEPTAFEILSASIRNGYQGLFEPKGKVASKPESNQRKENLTAPRL